MCMWAQPRVHGEFMAIRGNGEVPVSEAVGMGDVRVMVMRGFKWRVRVFLVSWDMEEE